MTYDEWRKTANGKLAMGYTIGASPMMSETALRLAFDAGLDAALAVLEAESKRNQDALKAIEKEVGT
jgi:hypothetical protein